MILSSISLQNFKNYKECNIGFSRGLNFIYGDNGNGKTNLLEAVSFLCFTKSFLQNPESDCLRYGEDRFDAQGAFENDLKVVHKVSLSYDRPSGTKKFLLNNEPVGRLSSFFGSYPLVTLSPYDMKLTSGTPLDRRRNFDILISQISRLYFDDLRNYSKALKQKNSLLRDNLAQRKYPNSELRRLIESWNDELAAFGSRLAAKRTVFIDEFKPYLVSNFREIVENAYEPVIGYESCIDGTKSEDELRNDLSLLLEENMDGEIRRGVSLAGPHRDNYFFRLEKADGTFDVRTFASQGEHKTYIVSLKLSEYEYLKDKLSGTGAGDPIILLDDVFSELDRSRTNMICRMVSKCGQIFLTTTNPDYLHELKNNFDNDSISTFRIVNGTAELNSEFKKADAKAGRS